MITTSEFIMLQKYNVNLNILIVNHSSDSKCIKLLRYLYAQCITNVMIMNKKITPQRYT